MHLQVPIPGLDKAV